MSLSESEYNKTINEISYLTYKIRRLEDTLIDQSQSEILDPKEFENIKKESSEAIRKKAELCTKYPFCCNENL